MFMKKVLIYISIFVFIFLLTGFTNVKTDTYAKTDIIIEKESVESGNNNIEKNINEEQNIIENEQEEIETGYSYDIDTSASDDYYEDDNSYEEPYYENYGTYGRLYIYDHSVALYDYNVYTYSSYSLQSIVDDSDSAAFYRNKGKLVIADHNYQGFSILNYLEEGDTSYIRFEDGSTISYTLIRRSEGYNTGPDLTDIDGNSFFYMDSDLIMYTCTDYGIMVTLWTLS